MLPERLCTDAVAAGLGTDGTFDFPAVCSIKAPHNNVVRGVSFYREIDGDIVNAPCFSRTCLVWLSAHSNRASAFSIMKTLACLIKLVHPFDEASVWLRDRSWESPS